MTAVDTGARAWFRRGRRVLLDLAVVVVAMTTVPILTVTVTNGRFWQRGLDMAPIRARLGAAATSRAFTVQADRSITPFEAGRSLAGLEQARGSSTLPIQNTPSIAATWRFINVGPGMFGPARPVSFFGPGVSNILEASGKGLSPGEIELLRKVAASPAWSEFDRVARAPSVDMTGGRYLLPFTPEATFFSIDPVSPLATKEMAYAAVARAAYHVAVGQRDSAEVVLRSIVSLGFSLVDNSTLVMDQLTGLSVIAIGTDGLERFYTLTHDARAAAVRVARREITPSGSDRFVPVQTEQMRGELLARVADPKELRGVRFESLELLTMASCTNVRELLFGPRSDVRAAFEGAKRDLARNPSERALIDLLERESSSRYAIGIEESSPVRRFLVGSATIAGAVLHNQRLAACTLLATDGTFNY